MQDIIGVSSHPLASGTNRERRRRSYSVTSSTWAPLWKTLNLAKGAWRPKQGQRWKRDSRPKTSSFLESRSHPSGWSAPSALGHGREIASWGNAPGSHLKIAPLALNWTAGMLSPEW